ncbi:MAG: DNA alkylation repair protein [Bacteroidetes bacterium]|nr:DNA alkylation repair protein [Bacteroidota bacterium]
MSPSELVEEIREICRENTDPAIVAKYSKYFQDGYDAYGLKLEQIEETVMEILDAGAGYKLIQQTCRILVRSPKYEETSFAILLTKAFEKDFSSKTIHELEFWFTFGITNWAHADVISTELIFPLFQNNMIGLKELEDWKSASNKFQRRAVAVGLIKPMKANKEISPYLDFLSALMLDKEKEVQQGLGWFLGEAWKVNESITEEFLMKWKNKSPGFIFQSATENMNEEETKRFRIEKYQISSKK